MISTALREEPVIVPGEAPLVGTLSRGTHPRPVGIVLLNAGLVQRAGPDGLHVRLAADLATRGFSTLRLDYSGVGDSPVRRDRISIHEARVLETTAALDWFQQNHAIDDFVLVGICTGADNAFRSALADERVAGLVLLDGYPYRTRGWSVRHYGPRVFRASSWKTLLRAGVGAPKVPSRGEGVDANSRSEDRPGWDGVARLIPTRDEMAVQLKALIDRGAQLYFVYTGGFSDWVNHAGQLAGAFRDVAFGDRVCVDYLAGADHVFRPAASQHDLEQRIGAWLEDRWPNS